jgi:hypothetical protein
MIYCSILHVGCHFEDLHIKCASSHLHVYEMVCYSI